MLYLVERDKSRMLVMSGVVFFSSRRRHTRLVRSRGLGDVYKRKEIDSVVSAARGWPGRCSKQFPDKKWRMGHQVFPPENTCRHNSRSNHCLLYTSDAADERSSVDLGGRRIINKKKNKNKKKKVQK